MYYARYQTATPLIIGPVIRATDGYSPLTLLTSGSLNFFYWVGTGPTTGEYATAGCSGITEVASGYYKTWISSDMTNALGPGVICYETSGSSGLPMVDHYIVLAQHTYDALIKGTGTDVLQVDLSQIVGTTAGITAGGVVHSVQSYIGSTGASMTSGMMTSSLNALISVDKYWGSTVASISTLGISGDAGIPVVQTEWWGATASTVSTAYNSSGQLQVNAISVSSVAATAFDYFSSGHVVDNTITWGDLAKVVQAQMLNNTTYDGTTYVLYDHAGTTFVKFAITTALRTRTTA